jgi:hypothetical protein
MQSINMFIFVNCSPNVGFEFVVAVAMENAVFWYVALIRPNFSKERIASITRVEVPHGVTSQETTFFMFNISSKHAVVLRNNTFILLLL